MAVIRLTTMLVGANSRLTCRICGGVVVVPRQLAVIAVTLDQSCKLYEAKTQVPLHRCEIRYGLECKACGIRDPRQRAWWWRRRRREAFKRPSCSRCHQMLTRYVVTSS